ncbi:L-threonylcarbamoyladenylate synthase [Flavobacteriales bacterium]|nr:L-threonylcarbamoyladenylate synthase [Flavobacteriales bacterium]MDC3336904.1 L-threonylcarbamoyladenylate synthase [Flavobacteriales bacterium]
MNQIIQEAIEVLKNGGIILYPTDTIWGLGCDATNEAAVLKLLKIKQRSDSKSLIILLDQDHKINRIAKNIPDAAWDIIDHAQKPTTLVLDGAYNLAPSVIASDGSVGIRICKMKFCQQLISKLNKPLVSTSANYSGNPSPSNFNEIDTTIKKKVDFVIDLPEFYQSKGQASSVIKLDKDSNVTIIRT